MQAVKLLFWLKWKLLLRGYRRSKSEWVGGLLLVLLLTPASLGIAGWFGYNFVIAGASEVENWLRLALLCIYAFWILVPILGYSLNDTYDITKLFVYPLSMRHIFAGQIAGTLLDRPTILLLPTFAAILYGFAHGVFSAVIDIIALALFLLHTLALSQAILMAGAGLFQSRKFRDTAVIVFPLIWIFYYLRFVVARQARPEQWTAFVHSPAWDLVNYLPQGLAARAIFEADSGHVLASCLYLAALAAITYGTFVLAGYLLQKVYAGDTASAPMSVPAASKPLDSVPAAQPAGVRSSVTTVRSWLPGWLPQVVRTVADKEFRYLARDPYYKMVLVNLLWPLLLPIFLALKGSSGQGYDSGPYQQTWFIWMGPAMMTFSQMQLCYNIFGTEGGAVSLLFLFPASRRQIVIGKNLFHFLVLSMFNLAMTIIVFVLSRDPALTALLFYWMELSLLINLSFGNLFSLYFPMRLVMRGWRVQNRTSGHGCLFFVIYLTVWFASLILFVPVVAALAVPMAHLFGAPIAWLAVSLPFGLLYVVGIYLFSLYLTVMLLPRREDVIVAKVSQEPT